MRGPTSWAIYVVPLLIFGLGLATVQFDAFRPFRDYVSERRIPETLVRSGRTGKEMRLLDYRKLAGTHLQGFDDALTPEDMPSTTILDPAVTSQGVPVLSIVVDSKDLLHRDTGLIANPNRRGRAWERPAYVSYFLDGQLNFATGAGVRVHGGKSRSMTEKSFRLYFRDLYGSRDLPLETVFRGRKGNVRTLVVHNDVRRKSTASTTVDWHFTNPIAYEIARRIGGITPDTQPVAFYLNGVHQGTYVLTEHVSRDFLVNRFGHDQFVFADTRSDEGKSGLMLGSQKELDQLGHWLRGASAPLTMAEATSKVDLDNLTNWFVSILYAGTTDPFQGAIARDNRTDAGRWFWITWDMDHSFMDWYSQAAEPWELNIFVGRSPIMDVTDSRAVIFNRLQTESPEFRRIFLARLIEVLNHELNNAFMTALIDRYERTAAEFGIENTGTFEIMRAYALHRPAELRAQMETYFDAGPSHRLLIQGPMLTQIRVDSHEINGSYSGWYFEDTPARIELASTPPGKTISWLVNGIEQSSGNPRLELHLTEDTIVDVVVR